ncbi:MAG: acetolactate synthase small subunit [Oscillospiraceae bacterium]|nr:acetolactate synthase small subunit [Oscillospiraceae bacterium]
MQTERFTVGVLVNNHYGVLGRITGLFSKRGYNIESLAVGTTENPLYSRITIVCIGDAYTRNQVVCQLEKLHDVLSAALFSDEETVITEHILLKIRTSGNEPNALISDIILRFNGKVRDFGKGFITAETSAAPERIDAFIEAVRPLGILETCRSGALAMSHGNSDLLQIPEA